MKLLYLDASGDPGYPPPMGKSTTRWYVVGGVIFPEGIWHTATKSIIAIASKFFLQEPGTCTELRYSSLITGDFPFSKLTRERRKALSDEMFQLIASFDLRLIYCAADKQQLSRKYGAGVDPALMSLNRVVEGFQQHLASTDENGIILMDSEEARKDRRLRNAILEKQEIEAAMVGKSNRPSEESPKLIEGILFIDSHRSPLIQLADFSSHAIWKRYEQCKGSRFHQISPFFEKTMEIM